MALLAFGVLPLSFGKEVLGEPAPENVLVFVFVLSAVAYPVNIRLSFYESVFYGHSFKRTHGRIRAWHVQYWVSIVGLGYCTGILLGTFFPGNPTPILGAAILFNACALFYCMRKVGLDEGLIDTAEAEEMDQHP